MKIYYISILEQYYQESTNLFNKDLYTKTQSDGKFYLKKKSAIKAAKSIFEELSEKEEYQQDYSKFIQNEDKGQFSLKTIGGNFLAVHVNELTDML